MQQFHRKAMELPAIPPSPTLTNPDMILPHDNGLESSASPPLQPVSPPSHMFHDFDGPGSYVAATDAAAKIQLSTKTSEILPGAVDGEKNDRITKKYPTVQHTLSASLGPDISLASSLTLANLANQGVQPTVKSSLEQLRRLASKELLHFSSDGSMKAHLLREAVGSAAFPRHESNDLDEPSGDEDGQYSNATLSNRAEMILANAKRRLDAMEGNLNRARRSLMLSPSSSMWSSSSNSSSTTKGSQLPKPHPTECRAHSAFDLAPVRQSRNDALRADCVPSHTRVFSETSVPSSMREPVGMSNQVPRKLRSIDRLNGVQSSLEAPHQSLEREYWDAPERIIHRAASASGDRKSAVYVPRSQLGFVLQPLTEDEPTHGLGIYRQDARWDSNARPEGGLARAQSTTQDLRLQMRDLKGKISSLQRRAREDGLRRQSIQSLRETTPFNSAGQWDDPSHQPPTSNWHGNNGDLLTSETTSAVKGGHVRDGSSFTDMSREIEPDDSISVTKNNNKRKVGENIADLSEDDADFHSIYDNDENDDDDDGRGHAIPVGARHEDRADAFDYEHSFLHSGLGHYTPVPRERRSSSSSTDSAETTRGPDPRNQCQRTASSESSPTSSCANDSRKPPSRLHRREKSKDSLASMVTFLTATEGRDSEDETHTPFFTESSSPRVDSASSRYIRAVGAPYGVRETKDTLLEPFPAGNSSLNPNISRSEPYGTALQGVPRSVNATTISSPTPLIPLIENGHTEDASYHGSAALDLLAGIFNDAGLAGNVMPSFGGDDLVMVERLLDSLRRVCAHLAVETTGSDSQMLGLWRSRLESARKILDGENTDELF